MSCNLAESDKLGLILVLHDGDFPVLPSLVAFADPDLHIFGQGFATEIEDIQQVTLGHPAEFGKESDADAPVGVFEEAFDLDIPDEDAEKIKTVKDAIDYIESKSKK